MRRPTVLAAAAVTGLLTASLTTLTTGAADARIIERGHFTDTFTDPPYDCDGLLMAQDSATIHITFRANLRGSSPFPFYVENTRGTAVTTNLATGGTTTQQFNGTGHDHTIIDNGDGTMTITLYSSGQNRIYDQFGNLVLHDAGSFRFSFVIDYQGTPSDPSDDTEVPDTFQIVREPTGRTDTDDHTFCENVLEFTTP